MHSWKRSIQSYLINAPYNYFYTCAKYHHLCVQTCGINISALASNTLLINKFSEFSCANLWITGGGVGAGGRGRGAEQQETVQAPGRTLFYMLYFSQSEPCRMKHFQQ
jgi:hypothetical protein